MKWWMWYIEIGCVCVSCVSYVSYVLYVCCMCYVCVCVCVLIVNTFFKIYRLPPNFCCIIVTLCISSLRGISHQGPIRLRARPHLDLGHDYQHFGAGKSKGGRAHGCKCGYWCGKGRGGKSSFPSHCLLLCRHIYLSTLQICTIYMHTN